MKNIIYLFVAVILAFSVTSCDKYGDLRDESPETEGIVGARYLYQEYNSIDTIAEYHYNGIRMVEVIGDSAITNLTYNGDLVNQIDYNAVEEGDSISYTQYFTYDPTGSRITTITETRSVFPDIHTATPVVEEKYKSWYDLTYEPTTDRLSKIVQRQGQEIAGTTFEYTSYRATNYEYEAGNNNVAKTILDMGTYSGGTYGPALQQVVFSYLDYDDKISPYTLLPFAYKITKTLANPLSNYCFSPNNPEKISVTTESMPLPIEYETVYTYDPQDYALSGFDILYDYRPF